MVPASTRSAARLLITRSVLGVGLLVILSGAALSRTLTDSPKALVDEAWQIIQRNYVDRTFNQQDWTAQRTAYLDREYTSMAAANRAIQTMVDSLDDPYTQLLSPAQLKQLTETVSGGFVGVGVTVSRLQGGEWQIEKVFPESPAAIAGLQPQDIVTHLNGKPTPQIDPAKAAPYLIGPVGSELQVQIRRQTEAQSFKLLREQINLNPLTYRTETHSGQIIGHIHLPVFTSRSAQAMADAIQALEAQQVQGYVLDLRHNPGGVLEVGLQIADLWLSAGTLVQVQERDRPQQTIRSKRAALTQRPVVILLNEESASASEVLAAALRENQRATLVGRKTFGKGVIQAFEPLSSGAGLLVTVARYSTPSGKDIHQIGLTPDIEVPEQADDKRFLDIAIAELIRQLRSAGS